MPVTIRPLWNIRVFGYAVIGAALTAVAAMASVPVLLLPWPREARGVALLAAMVVLAVLVALPRVTRETSVWLANRMLRLSIAPSRPHRWRTAAWLLVHGTMGCALLFVWGFGVLVAVGLHVVWLDGGGQMAYPFTQLSISMGPAGWWVVPMAIAHLVVAMLTLIAGGCLLRRIAAVLLGPDSADRVAAAEEQARRLARRNRLARDLHDSVGHTLTASAIQAAVAGQLMDTDPAGARRALDAIEDSSRLALEDLDHALGELRDETAADSAPPDLSAIHRLVEGAHRGGRSVEADISGEFTRIPIAVSREAFRFVQEGMTNAFKHASGPYIGLRTEVRDGWLHLEVTNPREPTLRDSSRDGSGLTGLRERVEALGGEMSTEVGSNSWRVAARMPLRSSA